jgi:hypothetical protein
MTLMADTSGSNGIRCNVIDEPTGARRYVLQVPALNVPLAQACIDDLLSGRYRADIPPQADDVTSAVMTLKRLIEGMS